MPGDDFYETAIHEAGHAAVGWVGGYDISLVTIVPEGQALGRTAILDSGRPAHPVVRTIFSLPREWAATRKLAGPYAEYLFAQRPAPAPSQEEAAAAIVEYRACTPREMDTFFLGTMRILLEPRVRESVFDVAEALLRRRIIDGTRVDAILGKRFGTAWRVRR